ncbi:MAG: hypothetical protein C4589_11670, partial [Peptococcaceae bacterium]
GVTCLAGAVIGLVPRKVIFDNNSTGNNFCLRMRFGYIESVDFLNADSSADPVVGLLIDTQNGGVMVVDCHSEVENATDMPAWAFRVTSTGLSIYDVVFRNCRGDALRKAHHTDVQTGLGVTTNPVTVYGGYFRGNFATDYDIYQTGAGTVQLVNPLLAYGTTSGAVTGFFFDTSGNLKRVGSTLPTIPEMIGDAGSGGKQGAAPAPGAGDAAAGKFLKADGTWVAPPGGGGGVWPKADKCNIDATEYSTIAALMAALSSGVIGRVGEGSFTSDGQTLPAGAMLEGSGIGVTTLTTSSNDKVLTVSGGPVRNLTLTNTRATGTKYGLYSNSGSTDLYNLRAALTAAGSYNYGFAFANGGGTYNLYNCQANVSGASTFNYALFNDRCVVNLHQPVFTGNIYTFGASSVDIYGGVITGNLEADTSPAVIRLHGLPTITGTLTLTSGGTIAGWYRDSSGVIQKAGSASIALDATYLTSGILPAARFNDTAHGNRGGGALHAAATTALAGFLSAADKTRLDALAIEHLGTLTLSGTGTFSWSSISGYRHLLLFGEIRSDRSGTNIDGVGLRFNGDTGNNYGDVYVRGQGTGASAAAQWGVNNLTVGNCNAATSAPASAFSPFFVIIPAITGNTHKGAIGLTYLPDQNIGALTSVFFRSGIWLNTAAITSVVMLPVAGGTGFIAASSASLYGVK